MSSSGTVSLPNSPAATGGVAYSQEARAIEPALNPALPAYMYSPLRAQANPVKATRSFADASHELGARILTGREITGVKHLAGGSYRIDTPARSTGPKSWFLPPEPGVDHWGRCWV